MSQWNIVEVCPVTSASEWIADVEKSPIIYD